MGLLQNSRRADLITSATHATIQKTGSQEIINLGIGTFTAPREADTVTITTPNGQPVEGQNNIRSTVTLAFQSLSTAAISAVLQGLVTVAEITGAAVPTGSTEGIGEIVPNRLYALSPIATDGQHHVTSVAGSAAVQSSNYQLTKQGGQWYIIFRTAVAGEVTVTYSAYTPVVGLTYTDDGNASGSGDEFTLTLYSEQQVGQKFRRLIRTIHGVRAIGYTETDGSDTTPFTLTVNCTGTKDSDGNFRSLTYRDYDTSIIELLDNSYSNALNG